jgi:hypothetical protein
MSAVPRLFTRCSLRTSQPRDDADVTTETFVALVAALGIGGIGGVVLRAEHERAERRRDRMIAVAEEFLSAVETAITATREAELTIFKFDHDERDDDRRTAAATVSLAALDEAGLAARSADIVGPRFSLIFPTKAALEVPAGQRSPPCTRLSAASTAFAAC